MNEDKLKFNYSRKAMYGIFVLFFIFAFLSGCDNNNESAPLGKGSFSLMVSSQPRTIIPNAEISMEDLKAFELIFSRGTGEDLSFLIIDFSDEELPAVFLDPGTYSLTVNAYNNKNINSEVLKYASLIARGTLTEIIIEEGKFTKSTITLKPVFFAEGTAGVFSYNITVPNDVSIVSDNSARMTIEPLNVSTGTPAQTILFNFSGAVYNDSGSVTLNSGAYNVIFRFERAGNRLVWSELLHVYSTLESGYSKIFREDDFYSLYHTITIEYNNGDNKGTQSVYHGAKIIKPPADPQRAGYGFAGWYTDDDFFINKWDFDTLVIHDVTLYAKWLPENHIDVGYDPVSDYGPKLAIGGVPVTQGTEIVIWRDVTDGRDKVTLNVLNAEDFDTGSVGWFYGTTKIGEGTELTLNSSNPVYNILGMRALTVEAKIEGSPYSTLIYFSVLKELNVTFFPNNGEPIQEIHPNYGDKITEPSGFSAVAVTRTAGLYLDSAAGADTDYVLDGWYLGETKWNFNTNVVHGDITLTAKWKSSNMVDLASTSGTTLIEKAFTYVNIAVNAALGSYTLYINDNFNLGARTINANNARLTIMGLGGIERVIQYNGAAGSSLLTVSTNSNVRVNIGENITLKGLQNGTTHLVNVLNGAFSMLDGSKITGHTTSSANGAVYISGGAFNLQGGEITGNRSTNTATAAAGGITIAGGTFNISGGDVSGNFRNNNIATDIYVTSTTANALTLSGNAKLGVLMLNATSTTDAARSTVTLDNWTGNAILHLRGAITAMDTAVSYWVNRAVIRGATTDGIASLALGSFVSQAASNNTQQIGNVYNIVISDNTGILRLNRAQTPVITTQPQGGVYIAGGSPIQPLTVTAASVTDGGVLTYQWHSYTTDISSAGMIAGATQTSFTPPDTIGTTYYYAVVTNTVKNALDQDITAKINSSVVSVTVNVVNEVAVYLNDVPYLNLETALDTITAAGTYEFKMVRNQAIAPRTFSSLTNRNITFVIDDNPVNNPVEIQLSGNGSLFTINSSNTFNLENGVVLKGHDSNNAPLIVNSGTFNMKEGSRITGNRNTTTSSLGGGVRNNAGTFNMSGGEISGNSVVAVSDNQGGGLYFSGGTLNLGGTARIINNTKETGNIAAVNNVYLPSPGTTGRITISAGAVVPIPANGMQIGVSVPNFTNTTVNTLFANGASAGDEQYFFADIKGLSAVYSSPNLAIVKRTPDSSERLAGIYMYNLISSWNNARLRIFINGEEINEIVSSVSSLNFYYFIVNTGDIVTFFWTKGTDTSYESYTSFAVYYDDSPIVTFPSSSTIWFDSNALVYRLYNTSSGTTEGAFLGMFIVP